MHYIRLSTGALKSHFHFDFSQDERCTWYELLLISRDSLYPGYLQQSEGQGYPIAWLAGQLGIPTAKAKRHIQKFIDDGSLTEDLRGCIKIVNWQHFQPSYNKYEESESSQNHKPHSEVERTHKPAPQARQPIEDAKPEPPRSRWQVLCDKKNYPAAFGPMTEAETAELEKLKAEREKQGAKIRAKAEAKLKAAQG